jgi:glycosyltransferase involved in cell wall biosynthesis
MMKILLITNMYPSKDLPYYGIFIKEQLEEMQKDSNLEIDLFYIDAPKKGSLEYLKSIFLIPARIKKENYDIIHIHYGLSGLFLLFFRPKAKVYLTLHGGDILIEQGKTFQVQITKKILNKVHKVIILNQEMERIMQRHHVKYEIIPCGTNTDFFKPDTKNLERNTNRKLILFPGDPKNEVKNFSLFTEVIGLLKTQCPHWDISYNSIHNLSRTGVVDLLNSADCLLMTSVSEGSPQVVKEALACNLPVVSVHVGDVQNILSDIPNCHISLSGKSSDLCELLIKSLSNTRGNVRDCFLKKYIYDNTWVAKRIISEYNI